MKVWNQDGQSVEMESVDARECVKYCGYSTSAPASAVVTEVAASELQAPADPVTQVLEAAPELTSDEQGSGAQKPTIAELRDTLIVRGIEFDPAAKKADLQALLDAAPAQ